jgi:hypothetical protein
MTSSGWLGPVGVKGVQCVDSDISASLIDVQLEADIAHLLLQYQSRM